MSKKMIVNESNIYEITEKVRKLFDYMDYINVNDYLTKLCNPYMYYLENYYTIKDRACFFTREPNNLIEVSLVFDVEESEFHVNDLENIRRDWKVDDVYVNVKEEESTVNIKDSPLSINIPKHIMELIVLIKVKVKLPQNIENVSAEIRDALSFKEEIEDLELETKFLKGGLKNHDE